MKPLQAFVAGLSPKEKKLLYATCAVVFLTLFDRIILGPIMSQSSLLDEKIKDQIVLIRKNLLFLQYKNTIEEETKTYGAFYTKDDTTHEELVAEFLSEVEGMAKKSNVALTNINPVTLKESSGYVQYSVLIECSSAMKDLIDFIYSIDNSKRPIRVFSYQIFPKNRNDYTVKCTLTVVRLVLIPGKKIYPTGAEPTESQQAGIEEGEI